MEAKRKFLDRRFINHADALHYKPGGVIVGRDFAANDWRATTRNRAIRKVSLDAGRISAAVHFGD